MSVTSTAGYLESLIQHPSRLAAGPSSWLNTLRSEAVDRLSVLRVPTRRDEEWRFTDISPLIQQPLQPLGAATALSITDVAQFFLTEATNRLVFVDGVFAPTLSNFDDSGLIVSNLANALSTHSAVIAPHLGQHAQFRDNVFVALNTAFLQDGAVVVVPKETSITEPVQLLFVATQKSSASYPRCLLVAETGSAVTLVEDYVSLQSDAYFTNAVTEIVVADNARVNHIRVQRDSINAFHIADCAVSLSRSSCYHSVSVVLGGRISRYNFNLRQTAEGSECSVDGLTLISGNQLADTHTRIDHARPQGVSRQLHKCIVGGSAHAVFNGKVMVHEGAMQTDSAQSNRNLLLTSKAKVDAKPQLEIFANDVKCTHGATVGQLDHEEVFYLRSRGLSDLAARNLLTYAFGAEIIDRIAIASLRNRLEQTVLEQTALPL